MIKLQNGQFLGLNKRSFTAGGLILTETEYTSRVFEGWHSHEHHHLSLIISGGNLEERRGKSFQALPGTALFYHQGEVHRNLHTRHPSKNINLEISGEFLAIYDLSENVLERSVSAGPDAGFCLLKMYREALYGDSFSASGIEMLLLDFLHSGEKLADVRLPAWMKIVVDYLQTNWQQSPDLKKLAEVSGVNPVTVSKHFSRFLGCTLGAYMRRLKVSHALGMMKSGKMSLTEVGYACGFADQSHFTRTFFAFTGFLPGAYQRL